MSAYYSPQELKVIQEIIDESDPFVLEVLYDKSEEHLMDQLEKLQRELMVIPEHNQEWRTRQLRIINTVRAVYQMKLINKGDPRGGLVIA